MRELTARALTTAGDAWGISGPTFLVGYFVFAVAATIIALRARRAIRAESPGQPASGWDSDPYHQQYSSDAKSPNDYRGLGGTGVQLCAPWADPDRPKGIYVRISQDRQGAELGVVRQEADCRALCERKGWSVVEVYADNDTSAYSGAPRPAWDRPDSGPEGRDGQRRAPPTTADRVIATVGTTTIPVAWITQTRVGGRIVTPLTNP